MVLSGQNVTMMYLQFERSSNGEKNFLQNNNFGYYRVKLPQIYDLYQKIPKFLIPRCSARIF